MSFWKKKGQNGQQGQGTEPLVQQAEVAYGPFQGDPGAGGFYAPAAVVPSQSQSLRGVSGSAGGVAIGGYVTQPYPINSYIPPSNSPNTTKPSAPTPKPSKPSKKEKLIMDKNANKSTISLSENNMDEKAHQTIYGRGYEMRKRVVGEEYVAGALEKNDSDFLRPLQQFATESAWGTIWTRPGLELKTRSLLNLVMLTALGKWTELGTHVKGAIRNGATEVEIREALLQASAYCGLPAGMEAFRVADRVLSEMEAKGELTRE